VIRWVALVLGFVIVFAVGIALGESLDDNSSPASTQTLIRKLEPLPLAPAARTTVTVTVQNP
jgi:hypothetical protein